MKKTLAFIASFAAVIAVVLVFSCDDQGDQREITLRALGEPDLLFNYEYSTFEVEVWVYPRRDLNLVYEFRRTVGACGGSGEWYIYQRDYAYDPTGYGIFTYELYDAPPTIVHQPIVSAPAGHPLTISAVVVLSDKVTNPPKGLTPEDTEITGVKLLYRVAGDSVATEVNMSTDAGSNSVFTAQIPAEMVTDRGVEYCIQACSNADKTVSYHWSRIPELKNTFFLVQGASADMPVEKAAKAVIGGAGLVFGNPPGPGAPFQISPISQ